MKAALPLLRATLGFLLGLLALLLPFIAVMTFAVLRSNAPHGAPTADDYRFGGIAIALLTAGFGLGAALLGRNLLARVPLHRMAIAGAGAVTLLLITMMLIGEPLGFGGAFAVAACAGGLASWLVLRRWRGQPASRILAGEPAAHG